MKLTTLVPNLLAIFFVTYSNAHAIPVKWTEAGGLHWSSVLEGEFNNIDLDGVAPVKGKVQKTRATEACGAIGARLPTVEDFKKIRGKAYKKITGLKDNSFWSASIYDGFDNGAYYFDGYLGSHYGISRYVEKSVVCVKP